jgi:hypothetical protein
MEMSGHLHAPAALIPGNDPGTHWIEGWMGLRAGLDAVVKTTFPSLPQLEMKTQSSSPQPSHYTDWATR